MRVFILLGATVLTGCAQWPSLALNKTDTATDPAESATLSQLLNREPADTLITLSNSPWGANLRIVLHETYAAASGRNCRRLTIEPEGQSRPALVCQAPKNLKEWLPVRLLQIGGRPVLTGDAAPLPAWEDRQ